MNEKNLIRFDQMEENEHRALSVKGGKASGRVRTGRRQLRETLNDLLEDEEKQKKICEALLKRAAKGDPKAFQLLRDTLGEAPTQKTEISRGYDAEEFFEQHKESLRQLFMYESSNQITDGITSSLLTYEQRLALLKESLDEP